MTAGRPTEFSEEVCRTIRAHILDGKDLKEIAGLTEINYETIQGWQTRNFNGFADKIKLYRLEFRLKKAEEFSDKLMDIEELNDKEILKLKQKESEFLRETIGKKIYSKRTEQTGADGSPLQITVVNYANSSLQVQPETLPTEHPPSDG